MLGFGSESIILPTPSDAVRYKKAHEIMTRPRMSLTLKLANGDQLSYAEVGDKNGIPVLWFSGPTTNRLLMGLFDEMAIEHGIRLICLDRPGRGASTPTRDIKHWEFKSWGYVVDEATNLLGITKFFVIGHSFGCSYALASYPILKDKMVGAFRFLSTWAPTNLPCMPMSYAVQRSLPKGLLRSSYSFSSNSLVSSMTGPSRPCQMGKMGPREKETCLDSFVWEILDRVGEDIKGDAYKAYEADWLLALEINKPFGFDHRAIPVAIKCWHGMDDSIAPLGAAMWMQREMKNFLLYAVEGASHNIYLDFAIMRAVFKDIYTEALSLSLTRSMEPTVENADMGVTETEPTVNSSDSVQGPPQETSIEEPSGNAQHPDSNASLSEQNVWK